jgi:transcriptional regulator with XRE-family HTH domain
VAKTIIQLRNENGWTQEELARRAGLHQVQIARIENGEQMPTFKILQKIATAFNCVIGFVTQTSTTKSDLVNSIT